MSLRFVIATAHQPNEGCPRIGRVWDPPRSPLAAASQMEANAQHTILKLTWLRTSPLVTAPDVELLEAANQPIQSRWSQCVIQDDFSVSL